MRFYEQIHWRDGLFIQAPHFQQLQRNISLEGQNNRQIFHPFPYGLLDYELDKDAFAIGRIRFIRLSAVMPDGNCVGYPGNIRLDTLDVGKQEIGPDGLMIYLAVPKYAENDVNLGETSQEKRAFLLHEKSVCDDNTGADEIIMMMRHANARLVAGSCDKDFISLPVLKLIWMAGNGTDMMLAAANDFYPPFLRLTRDCPLYNWLADLVYEMRLRRDKLVADFSTSLFSPETLSVHACYNMMQLTTINSMLAEFESSLQSGYTDPFGLYTQTLKFYNELQALNPVLEFPPIPPYDHENCKPVFQVLSHGIHSMLHTGRNLNFIQVEFQKTAVGVKADLSKVPFNQAEEFYLAINYAATSSQTLINAVERGDAMRLINPSSVLERIRGLQLQELRYPPRSIPAIPNSFWFIVSRSSAPRVWNKIMEEGAVV